MQPGLHAPPWFERHIQSRTRLRAGRRRAVGFPVNDGSSCGSAPACCPSSTPHLTGTCRSDVECASESKGGLSARVNLHRNAPPIEVLDVDDRRFPYGELIQQ